MNMKPPLCHILMMKRSCIYYYYLNYLLWILYNQYSHVSQLFILTSLAKSGSPRAVKVVVSVQLTTESYWGQASNPCQHEKTDVKSIMMIQLKLVLRTHIFPVQVSIFPLLWFSFTISLLGWSRVVSFQSQGASLMSYFGDKMGVKFLSLFICSVFDRLFFVCM